MVTSARALLPLPLPSLLLCAALAAQNNAQAFVQKREYIARFAADDVQALIAALPQSRLGRLLAEPECADMLATAADALGKRHATWADALAAAADLGIAEFGPLMTETVAGI